MSSFWKSFIGKEESPANEEDPSLATTQQAPPENDADVGLAVPPAKPGPSEAPKVQKLLPMARYGIDDAIKLMRTLPVEDNVDLVVRVIKKTLESLNVKVSDILEDASKRQESLRSSISEHQTAIGQLEREIETRRNEIAHLEDELAETTTVRERLQLAEAMPALKPTPAAPGVMKKDVSPPSTSRSAPPLPKMYQPKLGGGSAAPAATTPVGSAAITGEKRGPMPTPPPNEAGAFPKVPDAVPHVGGDDDDEEQPVESRDLLEKAP